MAHRMNRSHYADMFGPTTGRSSRDTSPQFAGLRHGGDDAIRRRQGHSRRDGQAAGVAQEDALDCVITNALVIDSTGIFKADIGIKNGLIAGIGKAGNPDVMNGVTPGMIVGVTPGMIVGVTTEVIAGEGLLLTAGGIDSHIHYICAAGPRGAGQRHHHVRRWRHRSCHRHLRDDMHTRRVTCA